MVIVWKRERERDVGTKLVLVHLCLCSCSAPGRPRFEVRGSMFKVELARTHFWSYRGSDGSGVRETPNYSAPAGALVTGTATTNVYAMKIKVTARFKSSEGSCIG